VKEEMFEMKLMRLITSASEHFIKCGSFGVCAVTKFVVATYSGPADLRLIGGFFGTPEVKARRRCPFLHGPTNCNKLVS
jgi:hypothetical protein